MNLVETSCVDCRKPHSKIFTRCRDPRNQTDRLVIPIKGFQPLISIILLNPHFSPFTASLSFFLLLCVLQSFLLVRIKLQECTYFSLETLNVRIMRACHELILQQLGKGQQRIVNEFVPINSWELRIHIHFV
jgi:hypothetical protein